jgi:hypothetical protein
LVDSDELVYVAGAIERDLFAVTFNPIASTFLKWLRFKVVRRKRYLHSSVLFKMVD